MHLPFLVARRGLRAAFVALALLACTVAGAALPATTAAAPQRIGIIGAGHIGSTLAAHWVAAGHEVMLSSRHPEQLRALAAQLGPGAHVGTPAEAAAFGPVVLVSVPYGALPGIGQSLAPQLAGKVVLDTGNPYPGRDGAVAEQALREGTGIASQRFLPGTHLVRAFNTLAAGDLRAQAHRTDPVAIPIAGDDAHALAVASALVRDAGFAPVVAGGLAQASRFDPGTPVFLQVMDAAQMRRALDQAR